MNKKTVKQLEKEIVQREQVKRYEKAGTVWENTTIEPSDPPVVKTKTIEPINIGLKQLLDKRKEAINRWEKSGLLEGLSGDVKENIWKLFEAEKQQKINE